MTVIEAISTVDSVKPNTYKQEEKIKMLSTLDGIIKKEIIDAHEGGDEVPFREYGKNSLTETLLVGAPYDEIYILWLSAKIDFLNCEHKKYNNSIEMYNAVFTQFKNYYHRTHMPKSAGSFKW